MAYTFKGRLCGYICDECPEPLAGVKIRLYRVRQERDVTSLAVTNPKNTFTILTDEEVKAKKSSLIAEVEADADGSFTFNLSGKKGYNGEAFEIDVYCASVPRQKKLPDPPPPIQFSITTLQPMWRREEQGNLLAVWDYCIPWRFWCGIRSRLGAWTICGQVLDCKTGAPLGNLQVSAFDVDWWQQDSLGTATTDAAGHFRIDYLPIDFKQTPFSPWGINIEWFGGPDLYFKVELPGGGGVLLNEPPSKGRAPGRQNVGPCFCVKLCVDIPDDPTHVDTIPLFTHVGQYSIKPADNEITPNGLTTVGSLAFTSTIPLIGIMPDGQNTQALEYRFQVGEYNPAGTLIVNTTDVEAGMMDGGFRIGELEYWDWDSTLNAWSVTSAPYYVNAPGTAATTIHRDVAHGGDLNVTLNVTVKPGGWIEIPRENELWIGGRGRFIPNTGVLVTLDTTTLTNESFDLTAPDLEAGQPVPAGSKPTVTHRYSLIYQYRVVGPNPPLAGGSLSKIVVSNTHYKQRHHPSWAGFVDTRHSVVLLDIEELKGPGAGCNKIDKHVHALFTAYHPFAGSGRVYFEGNTPPALPAQLPLVFVAGEAVSPAGGHDFNFTIQLPCAYILWLEVTVNLTSGYGLISDATTSDHIAFCKS
jgi:5-hydroxyisourate hydrolase-like protein (transthyretin family)